MNTIDLAVLQQLLTTAAILIPVTTGIVTVIRMALALEDKPRFVPLISLVIGTGLGLLFIQQTALGALVGVIVGLSSSGLWEFGKTTIAGATTKGTKETVTTEVRRSTFDG